MERNLDMIDNAVFAVADNIVLAEEAGELLSAKINLFARQVVLDEHSEMILRVCNFAENNSVYSTELAFSTVGTVHNIVIY